MIYREIAEGMMLVEREVITIDIIWEYCWILLRVFGKGPFAGISYLSLSSYNS